MNQQRRLIRELMFYKFQLGFNIAEQTKNIPFSAGEEAVDQSTITKFFLLINQIWKVLSNNPTQNHKSQQLQLVVGQLWPGVVMRDGAQLVGRMDKSKNFKEKWVYEEKVNSYKKWLQIICNSYM